MQQIIITVQSTIIIIVHVIYITGYKVYVAQQLYLHHLYKSNNVYCMVLPYVILWNPVFQFPLCSETLKVCSVDNCDGIMHLHEWINGCSTSKQPRILHDINNIVLLVSAIYQCNKNSQHILLKHINPIWIPFHLM